MVVSLKSLHNFPADTSSQGAIIAESERSTDPVNVSVTSAPGVSLHETRAATTNSSDTGLRLSESDASSGEGHRVPRAPLVLP